MQKSEKKVYLIYEQEKTSLHRIQRPHIENPQRIESIIQNFKEKGILDHSVIYSENSIQEKIDKKQILKVHTEDYYNFIEGMWPEDTEKEQIMVKDCYINQHTFDSSLWAAGGVLQAMQVVAEGKFKHSLSILRPPGHHSGASPVCHGFCFFNNVAIAVQHLKQEFNMKKILIFDWDIHHGDGTSQIFQNDKEVLYMSIHKYDNGLYFPKTGHPQDVGQNEGKGYNVNIGWNTQQNLIPGTDEYIYVFEQICLPIIKQFNPELIVVSAGFDAALGDPVGKCKLTGIGYSYMLQKLLEIQEKTVVVLEGGYSLDALQEASEHTIRTLMGEKLGESQHFKNILHNQQNLKNIDDYKKNILPSPLAFKAVEESVQHLAQYWPCLKEDKEIQEFEKYVKKHLKVQSQIGAGHKDKLKFEGKSIVKKTKKQEIHFYESLDDETHSCFEENQKLKAFIPAYLGKFAENEKDIGIILENLLVNKEKGSFLDIKFGQVTFEKSLDEKKYEQDVKKSKETTSHELYYRLSAAKIKDKEGNIIESIDKFGGTKENMPFIFKKVLQSNEQQNINQQALDELIDFLERYIQFQENHSTRRFLGTSLFFVVDNTTNQFAMKIIDFNYYFPMEQGQIDTNVIPGLKNIKQLLLDLKESEK
ncbi:hypothetical protein PPERSA_04746 [Pseudocohnilembus persalinus]|uniref:histone deacetylase n=1 Tax=Pseudocohnilembus persalinus TaxID=266149 RepID=A0A0V0QNX4_PSEPJ|nr:hypothetical protein PPERSA_04746 [Pseudocohnilembus persalinus]|eukprot:KRX03868.1 hypothetical protein PPERSA_04746 [Pseudocohnilembus persalinus]